MRGLIFLFPILLIGCQSAPPERIAVPIEVRVPVPVPCDPSVKPVKPNLTDSDEALRQAPHLRRQSELLYANRLKRDVYISQLETALGECIHDGQL